MRWLPRRLIEKQLTCPACGDIIADAVYRPFPGDLVLTAPAGHRLQPTGGAILLRQVAGDPDRSAYVRRNLGELIFDLRCRRGHSTLATMPSLARAIRNTPGRWVPAA
jgi:hypothetical protein